MQGFVRASDVVGTIDFPQDAPSLKEMVGEELAIIGVEFEANRFNEDGDPNKSPKAVVFLVHRLSSEPENQKVVYRVKQSNWRNVKFGENVERMIRNGAKGVIAKVVQFDVEPAPGIPRGTKGYALQ
jgi:hypothetical protein